MWVLLESRRVWGPLELELEAIVSPHPLLPTWVPETELWSSIKVLLAIEPSLQALGLVFLLVALADLACIRDVFLSQPPKGWVYKCAAQCLANRLSPSSFRIPVCWKNCRSDLLAWL